MNKLKKTMLLIAFVGLLPLCIAASEPVVMYDVGASHIASGGTIYIPGSVRVTGSGVSIVQQGTTVLAGDFLNDVSANNVFKDGATLGKYLFRGTAVQTIGGTADKGTSFINFPNLEVNNSHSVELQSSMGMNVNDLHLTKGKLTLLSTANSGRQTENAHLLVKGNVSYSHAAGSMADKGVVEVRLAVKGATENRTGAFFGFSPPVSPMYSDYFAYNFLTSPDSSGFFGVREQTIRAPEFALQPGVGYFVGQDVMTTDLDAGWGQNHAGNSPDIAERMTDLLVINRWLWSQTSLCYNAPAIAGNHEKLHTADITVTLNKGFNYLGNPYTSPLDLSDLLSVASSPDVWGVTRNNIDGSQLYTGLWVFHTGSSIVVDSALQVFSINGSFLVNQAVGSTTNPDDELISPMQMFIVWSEQDNVTMTIPKSRRTHARSNFLRSERTVTDELLLEVTDHDTESFDRVCVVFRPDARIASDDPYDADKLFNKSGGNSQLYTQCSDGNALTVDVRSSNTREMPLYLKPANVAREATISASRLESLTDIKTVLLYDRKEDIEVNLNQASYTFTTEPGDTEQRFELRFQTEQTHIEAPVYSTVSAYYHAGELILDGLADIDSGAYLHVYNVEGKAVSANRITVDGTTYSQPLTLHAGVYMVHLVGKRVFTTKITIR